jgi:hypothetical protein
LEAVGIETALVTIPNHMFAAYYAGGYIHPVETTANGQSFVSASNTGKQKYTDNSDKTVAKTREEWSKRDIKTPSDVGISSVDLSFPNIQTSVNQDAEWKTIDEGLFGIGATYELNIYCDVLFMNIGTATGQKCVQVVAYLNDEAVKSQNVCESVSAGNTESSRMTFSRTTSSTQGFQYRCSIN